MSVGLITCQNSHLAKERDVTQLPVLAERNFGVPIGWGKNSLQCIVEGAYIAETALTYYSNMVALYNIHELIDRDVFSC